MTIEIAVLTVGPVQTNCYIVNKKGNRSCVVIDPGEEAGKIAGYLKRNGLENEGVLLTHGHFDHITGVSELLSMAGGKLYASEAEKELLKDPMLNSSALTGRPVALEPEYFLKDGQEFELAGMRFQVLYTPGHTIGSCCFYLEEEKVLFSGDTVFLESVGRTDLPTGNGQKLVESIRSRIFTLPPEVKIYPGHGPETSIEYEKRNNPFV